MKPDSGRDAADRLSSGWQFLEVREFMMPQAQKLGIVNYKRVERLWREEGMQVPKKQCKRRRSSPCGGSQNSCVQKRPLRPNHVWSYDFVEDRIERGRKLRMLVVIDEFAWRAYDRSRHGSFTAERVVEVLQYLFAVRGGQSTSAARPGVRGPGGDTLARPGRCRDAVHRQRKSLGEWLRGELQQPLPR